MSVPPELRHLPGSNRFETIVDGRHCTLDYTLDGDVLRAEHTVVPDALAGRGIASRLAQAAVEHVRAEGLRIEPRCGYVRAWLARHPEHASLVAR